MYDEAAEERKKPMLPPSRPMCAASSVQCELCRGLSAQLLSSNSSDSQPSRKSSGSYSMRMMLARIIITQRVLRETPHTAPTQLPGAPGCVWLAAVLLLSGAPIITSAPAAWCTRTHRRAALPHTLTPLHEPHAARQSTPKTPVAHSTSTAAPQLHTQHTATAKPPAAT